MNKEDSRLYEGVKKAFNITSLKELAELLGYSSTTANNWYKSGFNDKVRFKIQQKLENSNNLPMVKKNTIHKESILKRIDELRKYKKISQTELSEAMGMSVKTYKSKLDADGDLELGKIEIACNMLGVDMVEFLLNKTDNSSKDEIEFESEDIKNLLKLIHCEFGKIETTVNSRFDELEGLISAKYQ